MHARLPDTHSQVVVPASVLTVFLIQCVGYFRYLHPVSEEDFDKACRELKMTQSVWTVDLAYLMRHLEIRHCFCTQTLGVDKGFRTQVRCPVSANLKAFCCSSSDVFVCCRIFIRNTLTRKKTE